MRGFLYQLGFVLGQIAAVLAILLRTLTGFAQANRFLSLGAIAGLLLGLPIAWLPLIGVFLAPLAVPLGVVAGLIAGRRVDRLHQGLPVTDHPAGLFEYLTEAFKLIVGLFGEIYRSMRHHYGTGTSRGTNDREVSPCLPRNDETRQRALNAASRAASKHGYRLDELLAAQTDAPQINKHPGISLASRAKATRRGQ